MNICKTGTVYVPECIKEEAQDATYNLLPSKSMKKYEQEFQKFEKWRTEKGVCGVNEDIVLAYFSGLGKTYKISSLWSRYSMLKSTLIIHENVDISTFFILISYLKSQGRTYKPKKAKILERQHIEQFLTDAPNDKYLMMKVVLLFGISGGCRCDELTKMNITDIEDKETYLYISVPDTKTYKSRSFTIVREGYPVDPINIYKKYVSLRPLHIGHSRFFINYKQEKCTVQPVGINTLSKIPRIIATYLNLPHPEQYTGHCFRRSSATLLVNSGGDLMTLKRHGGWKSSASIADSYVKNSVSNKIDIAKKIQGIQPSTSTICWKNMM